MPRPYALAAVFLLTLSVVLVVMAQHREATNSRDETYKIGMVIAAYVFAVFGVLAVVMWHLFGIGGR